MFFPWYAITMLGFESSVVIQKRLAKISLGGVESLEEMRSMFAEKADAVGAASLSLPSGGTIGNTIRSLSRPGGGLAAISQ